MRQAFAIALAATGALLAILFLVPQDPERSAELLRRDRDREESGRARDPLGRMVDLSSARGENVFTPQMATAQIDGASLPYQEFLLWCSELAPAGEDRFGFRDIRILWNPPPKTRQELEQLFQVPPETAPDQIGEAIAQALGRQASGATAAEAEFHGGRDFSSAERVLLRGGVRVHLADPRNPGRKAELVTESVELEIAGGKVVRARTAGPVTLTGTAGELRGGGLDLDPVARSFTLAGPIAGVIRPSGLGREKVDEIAVEAAGPLRFIPAENAGEAPLPPGQLVLDGPVELRQGSLVVTGQRLEARLAGDSPKLDHLELRGAIVARSRAGTLRGEAFLYDVLPDGNARLTVSGSPVTAVWKGAAGIFPGVPRDSDLQVSTPGTIELQGTRAGDPGPEVLVIGPGVAFLGPDLEVTAQQVRVRFERIPDNSATAPSGATQIFPVDVEIDGGIRGRGPSGSFSGERLRFVRSFDDAGAPATDEIELLGFPEVAYTIGGSSTEATEISGASLRRGPGSVVVKAQRRIRVVYDPLQRNGIEASADGSVLVQRLGAGGAGDLQAQVSARSLALKLSESWKPETGAAARRARLVVERSLESCVAEGAVAFLVPERLNGEGEQLSFDGPRGEMELRGSEGQPARLRLVDREGQGQVINAPRLTFESFTGLLIARGGVTAELLLPRLEYELAADAPREPTHAEAGTLRIWIREVEEGGASRYRLDEAKAEGAVHLRQVGGALLRCDALHLDFERREGTLRGAPARIETVRREDGVELRDWLEAPSIALLGNQAVATGPLELRLHARPPFLDIGKSLGGARTDREPLGTPPARVPIDISAEGDLLLSRETILLQGPAVARQGEPATGGFDLRGRRIFLFLVPKEEPVHAADVEVARCTVEGDVRFESGELEAEGDVLELDRKSHRLLLYAHAGTARLTWAAIGLKDHRRPWMAVDFSDPGNPYFESLDRPLDRGGR